MVTYKQPNKRRLHVDFSDDYCLPTTTFTTHISYPASVNPILYILKR